MRIQLFSAAGFAALLSLAAGGAQATAILMTAGAPVGGWVDPTFGPTNFSAEEVAGPPSFTLTAVSSFAGGNVARGALASPVISALTAAIQTPPAGGDDAAGKVTELPKVMNLAPTETPSGGGRPPGPAPFVEPDAAIAPPGDSAVTSFTAADQDNSASDPDSPGVLTQSAADVTGVPEPTSWALMVVGFGGLGGLLRRRRRAELTAV